MNPDFLWTVQLFVCPFVCHSFSRTLSHYLLCVLVSQSYLACIDVVSIGGILEQLQIISLKKVAYFPVRKGEYFQNLRDLRVIYKTGCLDVLHLIHSRNS
jgi:hypothetical protein